MLTISIPTVLIPTWQQVRRSRKRRGSVACTEQGEGSGAIRSKPLVRVSCIRLKVYFLEDETQWGKRNAQRYTMAKVALRFVRERLGLTSRSQRNRHTPNEGANGVENQPKYNAASHNVNMGSPKQVWLFEVHLYGDGVPIVPNRLPVMGLAASNQSGPILWNKCAAMLANTRDTGGKWNSFCVWPLTRKEDC